ncbi:MAG TPA: tRNA pseudouridine(13) synthase TruD [Kofleriaceae bacterium]
MLPYLTEDLPGIGGTLRAQPEDFVVDEVPAYLPSGAGDHVFVRIEKRGLATPVAVTQLARALGVRDRDIGVAGMKDRHAVTTQWLSLPPPVTPEAAQALALDNIRVLEAVRHPHKLRTGHVRANRFRLRVRDVGPDAVDRARAILERLAEAPGAPNWYGEQRFGRDGDNATRGRDLVAGTRRRGDRRMDRLMVSALQSELFNQWLAARLADGLYREAIAGDLLHKVGGGLFGCEEPAVDTARIAAGVVIPTGPMFGVAMRGAAAGTLAATREAAILDAAGLTLESFATVRAIAEGTRRDAAIAVGEVAVSGHDSTVEVAFVLPGGAYATAVMREVMKPPARVDATQEPS